MTREEAIDELNGYIRCKVEGETAIKAVDMAIEALKQPIRPKGTWILHSRGDGSGVSCSNCNKRFYSVDFMHYFYCPNCRADMKGETDET